MNLKMLKFSDFASNFRLAEWIIFKHQNFIINKMKGFTIAYLAMILIASIAMKIKTTGNCILNLKAKN